MFLVNLAVADLCVTGFVDPFSIIGKKCITSIVFVRSLWGVAHTELNILLFVFGPLKQKVCDLYVSCIFPCLL